MTHLAESLAETGFWPLATILFYLASREIYHRFPHAALSPLIVTPVILIPMALLMHVTYGQYL
jgi:putative effector of murein hydrolase